MVFLEWDEKLSVGIPSLDVQHQELIGMINRLHDAMAAGQGKAALGGILEEMVSYAKTHFANEERLMSQHVYPARLSHLREHQSFTAKAAELLETQKTHPIGLSVEVNAFLKDWLTKHILGTDKAYGPFLSAHGVT